MSNTVYPGSIDSFYNPQTTDTLASAPHHLQHGQANDAITAIETKVGTGASTPVSGSILAGNGTGTSTWATSLTSFPLTTPQVTTSVNDANGNKMIGFTPIASAVNNLNVQNNSTGNDVILSAVGSDTNINLDINAKGTGHVKVGSQLDVASAINANGGIVLASGQSMSGSGTIPTSMLQNTYRASLYLNSAQTTGATDTQVYLDTALYDPAGSLNASTHNFVCKLAGYYHFTGLSSALVVNSTDWNSCVYQNASIIKYGGFSYNSTGGNATVRSIVSGDVYLALNDTLSIHCISGRTSVALTTGAPNSYLDVYLISPT